MKKPAISYSNLLIQFIDPLLDGSEDEAAFLRKAKVGMIAWNFHVSDSHQLPYDKETKEILASATAENKEVKDILNYLLMRKQSDYYQYPQLIFKVEMRTKPNGMKTLYVESAPADKIAK